MLNSDLLENRLGIVSPSHFVNDFSRNTCFSSYILLQARNQEFFRGRGVFFKLGYFDKHSPTTREKKAPQGKNLRFFHLETPLNEKFYP